MIANYFSIGDNPLQVVRKFHLYWAVRGTRVALLLTGAPMRYCFPCYEIAWSYKIAHDGTTKKMISLWWNDPLAEIQGSKHVLSWRPETKIFFFDVKRDACKRFFIWAEIHYQSDRLWRIKLHFYWRVCVRLERKREREKKLTKVVWGFVDSRVMNSILCYEEILKFYGSNMRKS